jgi:hypothetical protein
MATGWLSREESAPRSVHDSTNSQKKRICPSEKMRVKRKARQVINDYLIDGIPTVRVLFVLYVR